jgi:hypothetical protein
MPSISVAWSVSSTAPPPLVILAAPVTLQGIAGFSGSGDLKVIPAVPVTLGPATADFQGAGEIVGQEVGTVSADLYEALRPVAG